MEIRHYLGEGNWTRKLSHVAAPGTVRPRHCGILLHWRSGKGKCVEAQEGYIAALAMDEQAAGRTSMPLQRSAMPWRSSLVEACAHITIPR